MTPTNPTTVSTSTDVLDDLSSTGGAIAEFGHPDSDRYVALYVFSGSGAELAAEMWSTQADAAVFISRDGHAGAELYERSTEAAVRFADAYRESPNG